jgi:putative flippase GtrA
MLRRQLAWFVLVGLAALMVHMAAVWMLVSHFRQQPLNANIAGFLIAFLVSFWGHSRLTFRAHAARARESLPRFFVVACLGFALNQFAYARLLAYFGPTDYLPLLALVLFGVALCTFILSRIWAFASSQKHGSDQNEIRT